VTGRVPREWDATAYDAQPLPHEQWGLRLLERAALSPDERVLEAGCGTGRDTELILAQVPDGLVVAVDGSARMLERLRDRVGDDPRLRVLHADLARPLAGMLGEVVEGGTVDVVLSVATFHWLADHGRLFRDLAAVRRPGGRLVAEWGGVGNVAGVQRAIDAASDAFASALRPVADPVWNFATVEATTRALEEAGFGPVDVALRPHPLVLERGDALEAFLANVVLGGHLERLPADRHADFVRAVADGMERPVIDYVRIEALAVRR